MLFERDGKFEYTHRIVKRKLWSEKKGVCHHKDFDKLNNAPSNLEIMDWFEHQKLHGLSGNKNSMYGKGYKVEGEKNGRYLHRSL